MTAEIYVNSEYVDQYNIKNNTDYASFPESGISLPEQSLFIGKGGLESEGISLGIDVSSVEYGKQYLLTLCVDTWSDNIDVPVSQRRVNYIIKKINTSDIRQTLYFEINDTNPLNALEYKLEDGSYFFDDIVLFAGNIWYNPETGNVQFGGEGKERNLNIDALLAESETYIQPLRRAGMKVHLGLLPHHSGAWLTNLSEWGCEQFAKEIAEIVRDAKLDGVNLDDEHGDSLPPVYNEKWFHPESQQNYLGYQLKKQMQETVPWHTEVSVYAAALGPYIPVEEDGKTYSPTEFIDWSVGDYGQSTGTVEGMFSIYFASGASVELHKKEGLPHDTIIESWPGQYGRCMWFSFNPVYGHGTYNLPNSLSQFKTVARIVYGQELLDPTGVYKKTGEGQYDPARYDLNY